MFKQIGWFGWTCNS